MAETTRRTTQWYAEIGDTGLPRVGGYVRDEFLAQLQGERGRRVFREMADNEPVIGGFLLAVNSLIRRVEWRVEQANDSPAALEAAEFVEQAMDDMCHTWRDMVEEALAMMVYGFAPMEVTYKRRRGRRKGIASSAYDDGKIAWAKVALRAQSSLHRWEFDDAGDVTAMCQMTDDGKTATIPAEKLVLFRTSRVMNNPEGRSVLRSAYRAWYFKKVMEETEGTGVARDLTGLPVGRVPSQLLSSDASPDEKAQLAQFKAILQNIRTDKQGAIVLSSERDDSGNLLYDLALLSTGGSRQHDTSSIVDRYTRAIATALLCDFMLLGQTAVGSFALSSDKTDLFAQAIGGFLKIIVDTVNSRLIWPMCEFNGIADEDQPSIAHGDLESPDLEALSAYVSAMTGAGHITPDPDLGNHLRRAANLPPAPDSEDGQDDPTMPAGKPATEKDAPDGDDAPKKAAKPNTPADDAE